AVSLNLKIPTPTWVVTNIAVTNNLSGAQGLSVSNGYTYASPVYDARDKQFYGFQKVTTTRLPIDIGDAGSTTTTTFATEACGPATISCTANDVDYSYFRALRGLPVVVEQSDAGGNHLMTTWNEYGWNLNYTGLDGRHVLDVWVSLRHEF